MRKGARNRQRKRRNLLQRQKRDATNKRMEAKALAEPFPHIASTLPNPRREVRQPSPPERDTLLDFFDATVIGIPGFLILSSRGVAPILDAEPGSFRELAQKMNE